MLRSKPALFLLLALVFALNVAETGAENLLKAGAVSPRGYQAAEAMRRFEAGGLNFENHDRTNRVAIYGYSISYFLAFPLLALGAVVAFAWREEVAAFRTLCLAVAIDYVVSLPFFLFFPLPERWAYPDSEAILLSDLWTSKLIEWIRPVSGLDNCFPSSHVSLMVVMILICYRFQARFRTTVLALGSIVILSTLVLGVHWVPDVLAGVAVGTLSVTLALRFFYLPPEVAWAAGSTSLSRRASHSRG